MKLKNMLSMNTIRLFTIHKPSTMKFVFEHFENEIEKYSPPAVNHLKILQ